MALVKLGGGVVAIAGKIGGTVFARNTYGQYARSWAKPVNVNSPRQQAVRALAGILGEIWSTTLTPEERAAWNEYGKNVAMVNRLGENILLSGFNHFCRSNAARMHAGMDYQPVAPTNFSLAEQDPEFTVSIDLAKQEIDITFDEGQDWRAEAGAAMLVYVGIPKNPGVTFFNGPWRFAGALLGNTGTPLTATQTLNLPFVVRGGQKVFARGRITRADGRLSNHFRSVTDSD